MPLQSISSMLQDADEAARSKMACKHSTWRHHLPPLQAFDQYSSLRRTYWLIASRFTASELAGTSAALPTPMRPISTTTATDSLFPSSAVTYFADVGEHTKAHSTSCALCSTRSANISAFHKTRESDTTRQLQRDARCAAFRALMATSFGTCACMALSDVNTVVSAALQLTATEDSTRRYASYVRQLLIMSEIEVRFPGPTVMGAEPSNAKCTKLHNVRRLARLQGLSEMYCILDCI